MEWPSVSTVICTANRPERAARAIAQWDLQDYPGRRELVLVDSGSDLPCEVGDYVKAHGRLLSMSPGTPLGTALNMGCHISTGEILQKWDDDDLYRPGFLARSARALLEGGSHWGGAAVWGRYLVAVDQTIRLVANGMLAGGTMALWRATWDQVPFRDIPSKVDAGLWEDLRARNLPVEVVRDSPELYTYVRHPGNMWRTIRAGWGSQPVDVPVDHVFRACPVWEVRR
jgi:glycosyltransferase involved in cell wall biosynthesis